MDDSAAEKIHLAEKETAESAMREKARLEKDFDNCTRKSKADFERLCEEIRARTESKKACAIKDAKKDVLAIRNTRKKELVELEDTAKKNLNKTVLTFVRIAGRWRA